MSQVLDWPTPAIEEDWDAGCPRWREITEEAYWELNGNPVIKGGWNDFLLSEIFFHTPEGVPVRIHCKMKDDRYFARLSTIDQWMSLRLPYSLDVVRALLEAHKWLEDDQVWCEYSSEPRGIVFGIRDNRDQIRYEKAMSALVNKLRSLGYNARRTGRELTSHGIIHEPGTIITEPQATLGEDEVYRKDCTSKMWKQFIEELHKGCTLKVDEAMADHWMNILPPKLWEQNIWWTDAKGNQKAQGYKFATGEGDDRLIGFWQHGKQWRCHQLPATFSTRPPIYQNNQ